MTRIREEEEEEDSLHDVSQHLQNGGFSRVVRPESRLQRRQKVWGRPIVHQLTSNETLQELWQHWQVQNWSVLTDICVIESWLLYDRSDEGLLECSGKVAHGKRFVEEFYDEWLCNNNEITACIAGLFNSFCEEVYAVAFFKVVQQQTIGEVGNSIMYLWEDNFCLQQWKNY